MLLQLTLSLDITSPISYSQPANIPISLECPCNVAAAVATAVATAVVAEAGLMPPSTHGVAVVIVAAAVDTVVIVVVDTAVIAVVVDTAVIAAVVDTAVIAVVGFVAAAEEEAVIPLRSSFSREYNGVIHPMG